MFRLKREKGFAALATTAAPASDPSDPFAVARGAVAELDRAMAAAGITDLSADDTDEQRHDLDTLRRAWAKGLPVALFESYVDRILAGQRLRDALAADRAALGPDSALSADLDKVAAAIGKRASRSILCEHNEIKGDCKLCASRSDTRDAGVAMPVGTPLVSSSRETRWHTQSGGKSYTILPGVSLGLQRRADGYLNVYAGYGDSKRCLRRVRPANRAAAELVPPLERSDYHGLGSRLLGATFAPMTVSDIHAIDVVPPLPAPKRRKAAAPGSHGLGGDQYPTFYVASEDNRITRAVRQKREAAEYEMQLRKKMFTAYR